MIGLIRSKLGGFMSERNLTEYLANIGEPEFEKLKHREEMIAEQVHRLSPPTDESSKTKTVKPPSKFTPRYQITNLFSQFTEEFTKSARNNGVELQWIGVGTWKTPPEIDVVSEKHLQAWQISQENMKTGNQEAMNKAESEAILGKMAALIQNVPIEAYHDIVGTKKQYTNRKTRTGRQVLKQKDNDFDIDIFFEEGELQELLREGLNISDLTRRLNNRILAAAEQSFKDSDKDTDHRDGMRTLLLEYRKELLEAVQFMKAKDEIVPPIIEEAIKHINTQMGFKHWAGSS